MPVKHYCTNVCRNQAQEECKHTKASVLSVVCISFCARSTENISLLQQPARRLRGKMLVMSPYALGRHSDTNDVDESGTRNCAVENSCFQDTEAVSLEILYSGPSNNRDDNC